MRWLPYRWISYFNRCPLHQRPQTRGSQVCNQRGFVTRSNHNFRYRLRLGEWDVNNDSEFYTHIEFDATDIFVHEEFYPGNLYNDIAMVRLKGYVDFTRNPHVSPVCLPDHQEDFAGQRCHVSGWGKDAFESGSYQHVLKEVELPIYNHGQCENMLRRTRLGPGFVFHQGFLCAGGEQGTRF